MLMSKFVRFQVLKAASMKLRIFWDLMMEAARTSETSVDIQLRTRQYIPEDSKLRCQSLFGHKTFPPKCTHQDTVFVHLFIS
jgi:hypothetical protein